jgi:hypothetical protein
VVFVVKHALVIIGNPCQGGNIVGILEWKRCNK